MELDIKLSEKLDEYQTKIIELKEALITLKKKKEEFNKLFPKYSLDIYYSWKDKD